MDTTANTTSPESRSRWQHFVAHLFPVPCMLLRDRGAEGFFGSLSLRSTTTVCWRDRLRILISGRVIVLAQVYVDKPVERADAETLFYVEAP